MSDQSDPLEPRTIPVRCPEPGCTCVLHVPVTATIDQTPVEDEPDLVDWSLTFAPDSSELFAHAWTHEDLSGG